MPPPTKSFTILADSVVAPDAPVDTTLMTALRDNDLHMDERIGDNTLFGASQANHRHTGTDGSAPVDVLEAGASGLIHFAYTQVDDGAEYPIYHSPMEVEAYWFVESFLSTAMAATVGVAAPTFNQTISTWHLGGDAGTGINFFGANGIIVAPGLSPIDSVAGRFTAALGFRSVDGLLAVGFYTGDGVANRDIVISSTSISSDFQPEFVKVSKLEDPAEEPTFKSVGMPSNQSVDWEAGTIYTDRITAFNSDGFEIGSVDAINQSGDQFMYIAWKEGTQSGLTIEKVNYTGNAALRTHSLTAVANAPTLVVAGCVDNVGEGFGAHVRFRVMYGNQTSTLRLIGIDEIFASLRMDSASGDIVDDGIRELAPGAVKLGAGHPNTSGREYDLWAFGQAIPSTPEANNPSYGI